MSYIGEGVTMPASEHSTDTHLIHDVTAPSDFARSLIRAPVLSSAGQDWLTVFLQRFQVPFADLKVGASCVHRVTLTLGGAVLVERTRGICHDRRWSDIGCSSLVPAGVPTTRSFKGPADFAVAYVTSTIVDEVAADVFDVDPASVQLLESLAVKDEIIERFGCLLLAEAEAGCVGTRLFTDTLTRALALHLLRTYSTHSWRAPVSADNLVGWRLRRVIDFMHTHLSENLPLVRLASVAGLSPSHFARAFRAATGAPPHRYLIQLRIGRARHLLEHTRLPVIDIGLRCGFEYTTHFATAFRKETGLSPRAYRAARCT